VTARQLEIKKTGKVNVDIKTETLEIEMGAQYNGKLEMKQLIKTEEKKAEH
jgi:cytoskeletal protein CcmA (bactofilin family)